MSDSNPEYVLSTAFNRERSVRRAVKVLDARRQRVREDLHQLVSSIALFVLPVEFPDHAGEHYREILTEALSRLGDETFAELVLEMLKKANY